MSVRADAQTKLEKLKLKAAAAHEQGRSPADIPLTLQDGLEIVGLIFTFATYYDHHHHDITINKQERETTGPL